MNRNKGAISKATPKKKKKRERERERERESALLQPTDHMTKITKWFLS